MENQRDIKPHKRQLELMHQTNLGREIGEMRSWAFKMTILPFEKFEIKRERKCRVGLGVPELKVWEACDLYR